MTTYFHPLWWAALATTFAGCSLSTQLSRLGSSSQPSESSGTSTSSSAGGGESSSSAAASESSEECERYLSISDERLEPIVTLIRCPDSTVSSSGDPAGAYGHARSWIRSQLDTGLDEPAQLLRASYVHLCAREMKEDPHFYPAMAIGCAWHADRVDKAGLTTELQARPASVRSTITNQIAQDIRTVHERALARFPKTSAAREWAVFYELPTRVRNESLARRKANAKTYQRLAAFEAAIQAGSFEGCVAPLREQLTAHLRGMKTLAAISERITDPVGYALAEALARCHYYSENEPKAGALLVLLEKARRQVSLAEQVHYAQLDILAVDVEKAEKFPNLVGAKYSSVKPGDLRPISPWMPNKLDEKWQFQKSELMRFQTREGRVAKIEPTAKGAVIQFQKERVPLVDVKCHETHRIDKIDREGKITYREECTSTPKGMVWSSPPSATVDEAKGLTAGRYVRVGLPGDTGVILNVTESGAETARVYRVADVVLGE